MTRARDLLVGAGDNGGDGLYAGAELAQEGAQVTAIAVGRSLHEEAFAAFVHAGGRVLVLDPADIPDAPPVFPQARGRRALAGGRRVRAGLARDSRRDDRIGVTGALTWRRRYDCGFVGFGWRVARTVPPCRHEPSADLPLVVVIDMPSGAGE